MNISWIIVRKLLAAIQQIWKPYYSWIKYIFGAGKLLKKSKTGRVSIPMLLLIFTLFLYTLTVSANADDEQLNDSEYDDELPAFNYDPEIFEKIKNERWFITTRGTMPVITNAAEKAEWEKKAEKCIHSFRDELQPYMKSNGVPLIGFGYFFAGYLNVFIDEKSPESVNDSFFDEIYLIINDHCEQEGISEVPVVFMKSTTITLDEAEPSDSPDESEEII